MLRTICWSTVLLSPLAGLASLPAANRPDDGPSWTKIIVESMFRSEGIAVADVNRDGRMDLLIGDLWYEAPNWRPNEIRIVGDYADGANGYSRCMMCRADDVNGDGWPDQVVVGFPGDAATWYENPRGQPGHWKEHVIWPSACNESTIFADLLGTGKNVLIMGCQPPGQERMGQMAWFRPGPDPTKTWERHDISEPSRPGNEIPGTFRFSHGLGVGDVNGDKRLDVICTQGWWEQPPNAEGRKAPWPFHSVKLGGDCAQMYAFDFDSDGKPDILSSSAHDRGIWRHKQRDKAAFTVDVLFKDLFSQSHALEMADLNGDGLADFVTGKRYWAHGPNGDVDADKPAVLYWFQAKRSADGWMTFEPRRIDDNSGIGTQFSIADINGDGRPDIATANKKGVYVFLQKKAGQ